ncbi:RHS repeat-associated core domain-containing protein [Erwinia pyrifoliae]
MTRYRRDAAGRLHTLHHADGSEEHFTWNERGQLVRHQDPPGSETHWRYNLLGQPVSITDRINRTRNWHYNPRGWLTRLENGNGGEYQFSHDAAGRITAERRPDNTDHLYRYGPDGQLAEHRETGPQNSLAPPAHRLHRFRFDGAGRPAWRGNDSAEWQYHYDAAGRLSLLTRTPTAAGAEAGIEADRIELQYDRAGNLLCERGVNGGSHHQRDARRLTCRRLRCRRATALQWLHHGRPRQGAQTSRQRVSEFTRDRLHRETGRSQGALHQQRRYDALGRRSWQSSAFSDGKITRPEDGILWRAFRYTGRGELAGISDALRGEVHYGYDAEGRLLQHRELKSGRVGNRLLYDAADNLLGGQSPHDDPAQPPPPPLSSNRLPHWQRLFYRYDVWGNLVSRRHGVNEQHYTYDADNRLIHARGFGPQGEFPARNHNDALGRRSRKEVTVAAEPAQTPRFLWQGYRLLQEQRGNGTRRTWSYDPASPWTPLAAIEQAGDAEQADIYWLNADLNSAPLEVTDAGGNLRWSGQYDTFGKLLGQTVAGAAQRTGPVYDQPLRYAGQYQDNESGLHYNLFRFYEPDVGRFTTQDPISIRGGLNLYAYAPNPYGWVDPLGLSNFFIPSVFNAPSGSTHTVYQQKIDWDLPVNTRSGVKTNLDLSVRW